MNSIKQLLIILTVVYTCLPRQKKHLLSLLNQCDSFVDNQTLVSKYLYLLSDPICKTKAASRYKTKEQLIDIQMHQMLQIIDAIHPVTEKDMLIWHRLPQKTDPELSENYVYNI